MAELAELLEGHVSVALAHRGLQPWRLRQEERRLYGPRLAAMSSTCASVKLRGRTSATRLRLHAEVTSPESMAVDLEVLKRTAGPLEYELYLDGRFFQRHVAGDAAGAAAENAHVVEFQLPHGEKLLELWLPCSVPLTLLSLETDGPSVSPVDDDRPVWICYGSSITHGGPSGSSASNSWPALLARAAHFKLLNLGFGGECYLDPAVAFVIRDAPCELITLEVGINIQTTAAMNKRTFPAAVYGFIHIIREKHRTVPIVVISPLRYEPLEARAPVGTSEFMSLQELRASLFSCVETLIELGDQNIFYCDGLELLHEPELFFDGLHPGPRGQRRIVERLWPTLRPLVGASTQEHFELPEELPSEANELTGAYVVDMPGEGRSRMVLQLHRSQLVALSERRDWPPAPLQRRDDFVFVLNMPGVWGQVKEKAITFSNGVLCGIASLCNCVEKKTDPAGRQDLSETLGDGIRCAPYFAVPRADESWPRSAALGRVAVRSREAERGRPSRSAGWVDLFLERGL
ncbi:unnamed protein product [Durusdinium trenchii]|uniref:SGNH hydrolase-type esterase domain-containing protein n=1 Tax=Durusdinium trenchii TaxID=1381693 RepID=A0ABP0J2H2_9DINO